MNGASDGGPVFFRMDSELESLLSAEWPVLSLIAVIMIVVASFKYGPWLWSLIPNPFNIWKKFKAPIEIDVSNAYLSAFGLSISFSETLRITDEHKFHDFLQYCLTFVRAQNVAGKRLTLDLREVHHINSRAIQEITAIVMDVAENNNVFLRVILPRERLEHVYGALIAISRIEKQHIQIMRLKGK